MAATLVVIVVVPSPTGVITPVDELIVPTPGTLLEKVKVPVLIVVKKSIIENGALLVFLLGISAKEITLGMNAEAALVVIVIALPDSSFP